MASKRTTRLFQATTLVVAFAVAAVVGCHFYRQEVAPHGVRGYLRRLQERDPDFVAQDVARRAWHPLIDPRGGQGQPLTPEQQDALEQVRAIGYLDGYEPAPDLSGVTRQDPARACDGLNLYVSGHASEARLMDMDGAVIHQWHYDFWDLWPDYPKDDYRVSFNHWRRAHLLPDGELLAIFNGMGLIKIDRDSRLIWVYAAGCHHDISVTDDGAIYVLTEEKKVLPRISPTEIVFEDFVVVLDAQGQQRRKVSLLECFERSPYAALLNRMERHGDIFHTNTLEVFDGRLAGQSPLFKAGNALVSVRQLDTIAIVDLGEERVVWALTGLWHMQHQPTLLDNGRMLVFDNQGFHGKSQVLEIDPWTQAVAWAYAGDATNDFYSELSGSCQRLPNGNTLITESNRGRAFEVTPDKTLVWEFFNPHRAGDQDELIATLFEVVRVPRDAWPEADAPAPSGPPT